MRSFLFAGVLASGLVLICACTPNTADKSDSVRVALDTDLGTILVDVSPQKAPLSAGDFLRYVDNGLYENAGFYRVVRPDNDKGAPIISVVQGGALEMQEAPTPIAHETTQETGLLHLDGALSIARAEPGTGSAAAFFIVVGDQPSLDFGGMRNADGQGFAVFGRVIHGMDVVREINALVADAPTEAEYVSGQILSQPIQFSARRQQ